MELSDRVLAYHVLKSANLSEDNINIEINDRAAKENIW